MTTAEKLAAILAAVQTDPGNRGLARIPHDNLFTATAGDFQNACQSLADDPEGTIAVFTGFYIPTGEPPAAETDGPLGARFLTEALARLRRRSVVFTDVSAEQSVVSGLRSIGLERDRKFEAETTTADGLPRVAVLTVPGPKHPWHVFSALDWFSAVHGHGIRHVISIERVGPSHQDGRCYSMRGRDISDETAPMHHLLHECQQRTPRIQTIGIGDGGNEMGMGRIPWATIARNIPNGAQIACRVPTDQLIVAGVSNWGAYAIAAGLFVLQNTMPPPDLFDPARERRILEVMVREGPLVDGVTGKQTATVDGLTWEEYSAPLVRIREILAS
jgi:D-glutamate cyclase